MKNPFTRSGCPFRCETKELGKNEAVTGDWFTAAPYEFANYTSGVDYWQGELNALSTHVSISAAPGGGNVDIKKFRKYCAYFSFTKVAGNACISAVNLSNASLTVALASNPIGLYQNSLCYELIPNASDPAGYAYFNVNNNGATNTTKADSIRVSLVIFNVNRRYR